MADMAKLKPWVEGVFALGDPARRVVEPFSTPLHGLFKLPAEAVNVFYVGGDANDIDPTHLDVLMLLSLGRVELPRGRGGGKSGARKSSGASIHTKKTLRVAWFSLNAQFEPSGVGAAATRPRGVLPFLAPRAGADAKMFSLQIKTLADKAALLFNADRNWTATAGFGADHTKKFSHLFVRGGRCGTDPCPGKVLASNLLRIKQFDNGQQPRYSDRLLRAHDVFMSLPSLPGYHDPPDAAADGTTPPVKASDVAAAHAVVLSHRRREADPPWRSGFCNGARVLLEYLCRHAELRSNANAADFSFRPFTGLQKRVDLFHEHLKRKLPRDYHPPELKRFYEHTTECLRVLNSAAHGGRTPGVAAPRPSGVPEPDHESVVRMVRRSSRRARLLRIAPTRFIADASDTTTPLSPRPFLRHPPPCHPPTPRCRRGDELLDAVRFLTFDIRNDSLKGMLARDDDDESPLPVKAWLRDVDTDGEESSDDDIESDPRLAGGRGPSMVSHAPGPTGATPPSGRAPSTAASGSSAGPSVGAEAAPSGASSPPVATVPQPRAVSETMATDGAQSRSQTPAVGPAAPIAAASRGSPPPRRPSPARSAPTSAPGPAPHGHVSSPQAPGPGAPSSVGAFPGPSIPAPGGSTLASKASSPPRHRDRSRSRDRGSPPAHCAPGGGGRSGWVGSGPTAAHSAHAPRRPRGDASVYAAVAEDPSPSIGRATPGARSTESLLRQDVEDARRQAHFLTAALHNERRAADGAAASLADVRRDLSDLQAALEAARAEKDAAARERRKIAASRETFLLQRARARSEAEAEQRGLQQDRAAVAAAMAIAQRETDDATARLTAGQAEVEKLRFDLDVARHKLSRRKGRVDAQEADLATVQSELTEVRSEAEGALARLASGARELRDLNARVASEKATRAAAQAELARSRHETDGARTHPPLLSGTPPEPQQPRAGAPASLSEAGRPSTDGAARTASAAKEATSAPAAPSAASRPASGGGTVRELSGGQRRWNNKGEWNRWVCDLLACDPGVAAMALEEAGSGAGRYDRAMDRLREWGLR